MQNILIVSLSLFVSLFTDDQNFDAYSKIWIIK